MVATNFINSVGSFTSTFTIPAVIRGNHTVKAKDASNKEDTATFTIGEKITIVPASGLIGDEVTVSGSGFVASSNITIIFDGVAVITSPASVSTNNVGSFTATLTIPAASKGAHTIEAEDAGGNSAAATFTMGEKITIDPASGLVGDIVTVSGNGFGANKSIDFYLDGVAVSTDVADSDASGRFSGSLTIPATFAGSHTVEARDSDGNSATATLTVEPQITIDPASGLVGDIVTVSGNGFGANKSIDFYLDDVAVSTGAATSDASGRFTGSLTIPASSGGSHTLEARDSVGNSATATLTVEPKMAITPTTGDAGTEVTVSGTGFGDSKTVTIKYNGEVVATSPAAISTDASGSFSGSFSLPEAPAGSYVVEASDGTLSDSADFVAVAGATISSTGGNVGDEIVVSGTGFKANTTVTVTYEAEPDELDTATTDSNGSFAVTITIPPSVGGAHTITATDGETTKQFTFAMEQEASPTPQPLLPLGGEKPKQPVQFDWADVTDPSLPLTYTLQIAMDEDFTTLVLAKTGLTESEYTMTKEEKLESTKKENPYYWRVQAIDGASNESGWGTGSFYVGFVWPTMPDWVKYLLLGLGVLVVVVIGFWLGMRRAYSSF